jgi:hypothetical protein
MSVLAMVLLNHGPAVERIYRDRNLADSLSRQWRERVGVRVA